MNYQPTLDKATDKQLLAFQRHFLKNADTFCVDTSGNEDVKDLHAKKSEIRKLAKSIIDNTSKEKRGLTDTEKDAFDVCTFLAEDVSCSFDMKSQRDNATRSINGVTGVSTGKSLESYQDQATGKAIPVLGKEHRFVDHISRNGNEISAKDYFASICGHNVNPEVRSTMTEGNDTKGGFMVPEVISGTIIDLLRAKNQCINAGMLTIPLPAQTTRVCRVISDPTAQWVSENALIPEDSAMSIGALDFNCHKLTCLVKVSRELLQDAGNAGNVIQNCISSAMAQALDEACLYGTGNGQPQGIANSNDINTYSLGVNGSLLSGYDDLLKGLATIVTANAPIPDAAIMHPRTMVNYSLLKDGDGLPLVKPELIKNLQFYDTTKILVTQVQGNSNNCSSIIMGSFNQLVLGIRSQLEMLVLKERYAEFGQIAFLVTMRADTAIYQPSAFCKVVGIQPYV